MSPQYKNAVAVAVAVAVTVAVGEPQRRCNIPSGRCDTPAPRPFSLAIHRCGTVVTPAPVSVGRDERLLEVRPRGPSRAAEADHAVDAPVQRNYARGAGALVQGVHVLRNHVLNLPADGRVSRGGGVRKEVCGQQGGGVERGRKEHRKDIPSGGLVDPVSFSFSNKLS